VLIIQPQRLAMHQLHNVFPAQRDATVVKMHPTDIKVFFADLLTFDLPVLRRVVNFGGKFPGKI